MTATQRELITDLVRAVLAYDAALQRYGTLGMVYVDSEELNQLWAECVELARRLDVETL